MTEHLTLTGGTLAYDVAGEGPLVVLAHGMGDTRRSYRFLVPGLVAAGYRVANVDLRGAGESSTGWDGYTRTDVAGDLVALVRHLGGPAVLVGQSLAGGAVAIAAATAPDLISGVVQLAPFTRKQTISFGGLLRVARYRASSTLLTRVGVFGSLKAWTDYLDLAYPTKPADWAEELDRTRATLSEPGRDEGPPGHGPQRPHRRRRPAAERRLPRAGRHGQPRPRLGRPPRRGREDPRRPARRPRASSPSSTAPATTPTPRRPSRSSTLALPFLDRTLARA